jgi:heat shock protein HslJ
MLAIFRVGVGTLSVTDSACTRSAVLPHPIGGTWVFRTITTDKDTPAGTPAVEITMTIKEDGTLVGNGGRNSYSAPYTITGGITTFGQGITIGPGVSTLM